MPSWSTFAVFVPAALVLLLVPGPSVLYVVTRSVDQGRAAGIASVGGVASGSVVHVLAAALGVSIVLTRSAEAFAVVKLAGAAYLVVLGTRRLLARGDENGDTPVPTRSHSARRCYWQGVLVEVLNPKVAIFFLAFLPQFVDASRPSPALQTVVLGLSFSILGCLSDGCYALAASSVGRRWSEHRATRARVERASGLVYIALGLFAALTRRPVERTA
jgi:threonine/homoserine/homoserine lactone efflux protein